MSLSANSTSDDSASHLEQPAPRFEWGWHCASLGVVVGALAFTWFNWDAVLDPIPSHFDASGRPDSFVDKTLQAGLLAVGWPIVMVAIMAGTASLIVYQSKETRRGLRRKSDTELNRQYLLGRGLQSMVARYGFMLTAVLVVDGVANIMGYWSGLWNLVLLVAILVLVLIGLVFESSRINRQAQDRYPPDDPADKLKAGLFYVNPNNPSVFVDVNSGMNMTLNFAHRLAWWISGIFIAVVALMVILPTLLL